MTRSVMWTTHDANHAMRVDDVRAATTLLQSPARILIIKTFAMGFDATSGVSWPSPQRITVRGIKMRYADPPNPQPQELVSILTNCPLSKQLRILQINAHVVYKGQSHSCYYFEHYFSSSLAPMPWRLQFLQHRLKGKLAFLSCAALGYFPLLTNRSKRSSSRARKVIGGAQVPSW